MSGIYIPMEMPKSCHECVFGKYEVCQINLAINGKDPPFCPLIPVPDHGRLIDADALLQECQRDEAYGYISAFEIDNAPTIIQADPAVMHYPQVPGITPTVIAEEVYDKYTDTAGNVHWTGTHSGKHIIPAEEEEK